MIKLSTKFEVSSFAYSKDRKGNTIYIEIGNI